MNNNNFENLLIKLKNPNLLYILTIIVVFLIIMLLFIINDISLIPKNVSINKSKQQIISDTFIILFFSILVVLICFIFLPTMKDLKKLFEQISNVTYVLLYTIFFILFYTLIPSSILNKYYYILDPILLILGIFAFYKSFTKNYIETFNINYERIKIMLLLFCFITLIITFYNINPGGIAHKYFGYSLLLTIIIAVFAFIYLIIIINMGNDVSNSGVSNNLFSNFSSFGVYGSILFIIFLSVITIFISYNKESIFNSKEKSASIIIILLMICIIWVLALFLNLFNNTTNTNNNFNLNKFSLFKKGLLAVFGLVISGLIIYWFVYNIESLSGKSSIFSFILNLLLVIIILGLIYKIIYIKTPIKNREKNAFLNLILTIIFYIPCIVSSGFDWIGKILIGQYNSTDSGSIIMLIVTIILFITYFNTPSLFNYISIQGGKQLVNKPVFTDNLYNLGNYQDLNKSDTYNYQFAISAWIFIDAMPPNTNSNYNKFTSLLNFGNKPNVLYNSSENTLMITMKQKDLKEHNNKLIDFDNEGNRIIYINKHFLLQKWNNLIINYNGGTLDIFINGELVNSSIEVVPYYTYDNLTIGENNGIKGGICNVIYFRKALTSNNIYYLYNTVKNRTPPTLNDSNKTILVNNINTLKS